MGERPALEGTYGHGGGVMAAARLSGRAETDIDDFSTNCFFAAAPLTERLLGKTAWCSGSALLRYPVNKPAVFGDFVALREKITQVCDHTY